MKNVRMRRAGTFRAISRRTLALSVLITTVLTGCAFAPPKQPHPTLRDDVPLAGLQAPTGNGWPSAEWWRGYNDPQLDQLIAMAMQHSPDLTQAKTRVQSAEQSVRVAAAQAGLTVNGSAQVARQRLSEHGMIPPAFLGFTWYDQADLGLQFEYDFDWWGKKRASIESALDQAHAAEAQRSAAALTIQNAIADMYFGWLADEARITLAQQSVAIQQRLMQIATLRVKQGVDLPDTLQQARGQLVSVQQMQISVEGSAQVRKAALAALLGVSPAELPPLQPRALPEVTSVLPVDARLDLIARRPDIVASRWQVEAALKQTDVARAQFFPDVSISALAGLSSINQGAPTIDGFSLGSKTGSLGHIFDASSRVFGITPAVHLPIFEGGRLQANYGVSKAQLDAAVAGYNATVTNAARDVATQTLTANEIAANRDKQAALIIANQTLVATADARARRGVRDAREGLAADAQLLQQRDQAINLHAQALSTDLALIKALGGGYHMPATSEKPQAGTPSTPSSNLAGVPHL